MQKGKRESGGPLKGETILFYKIIGNAPERKERVESSWCEKRGRKHVPPLVGRGQKGRTSPEKWGGKERHRHGGQILVIEGGGTHCPEKKRSSPGSATR